MKNLMNILSDMTGGERKMLLMVCALAVFLLTGCSASGNRYTREELDNLARLEVYEAESGELIGTIEDEETLYRYNQALTASDDAYIASEEEKLEETAGEAGETYYIVAYKYSTAKFGDKEPQKNTTITLYRDTDIAKMSVAEGVVKNIALPEELLMFYYEMSEEERDFYKSILP